MNFEQPSPQETPERAEQPRAEPDVLEAVQDEEDLQWDASKKDHKRYWVQRLDERPPADVPPEIAEIVRASNAQVKAGRRPKMSMEENGILSRYIAARVDALKRAKKNAARQQTAVEAAVGEMRETVEKTQDDEEKTLGHALAPERPELEAEDFKNSTSKPNWPKYWIARLRAEAEALPDEIRRIVLDPKKPRAQDFNTLQQYVNARLHTTAFTLAKRKEMTTLRQELRRIDERDEMEPMEVISRRAVSYDEAEGGLYVEDEQGDRMPVTEGDIVADMMWGLKYRPESSVPPAVWRRLRKLSAIKEARSKIEGVWNREIAEREGVGLPTTTYSPEFLEEHPQDGIVAERIAQSLLTRFQYDHPETGLRVEASNAVEDAVLKYDFKIVFPEKRRGVALQEENGTREAYVEEKRRLGVQFTISKSAKKHKTEQITEAKKELGNERFRKTVVKPVDDIVLITVPMKDVSTAFKAWLEDGKPSGGPERYLSEELKRMLLLKITSNVPGFDPSVLDEKV